MIPSTYAAGATPAQVVFTQTLDTALVATNKIVITTMGKEIFAANGATTCAVNDGAFRAMTSTIVSSGVLTITINAAVHAVEFRVTCT
jgi:hypothetical protein